MAAKTVPDVSAISGEIETTEAAGSESHNNREENLGSSSNNKVKDFKLLDSVYSAAVDGDINVFEQHKKVVDQILTPNGNTILHIYITARPRRVNDYFVRGILEMCSDLLWQANKEGETLLHMAARHGHADIARFLLYECKKPCQNHDQENGIKATRVMLQMVNEAGDTALHEAVRYNYLDVVKLLTKEDPSLPYEANTADETPLYLAAERGYTQVLKEILSTCISPADRGPYDRTALHVAVISSDKEMTRLLLAKESICSSKQDQQGWTPLHFAAHFGYIEILRELLTEDTHTAYMSDNEGKTALHVAAAGGKVKIMQQLLSTCPGCCELVDNRGWNVLHFAVTTCNDGAIRLVLQNPALQNLVNQKDENGNTPFLQAVSMGGIGHSPYVNSLSGGRHLSNPKVDKKVFNHHNHNAADIITANKSRSFLDEFVANLSLWLLEEYKVSPGMRTRISENDKGKSICQQGQVKEEVNTISSGSEDGINMRAINHANKVSGNNLLAATLIATVSFAAGITIPGGFITDKGPHQGTAILTGNAAFRAFVVLNTMSLFLSSLAVFFHLFHSVFFSNTNMKHLLGMAVGYYLTIFATMAMMGAFLSGTWAVLQGPDKYLAIIASCAVVAFFLLLIASYKIESVMITHLKTRPSALFENLERKTNHSLLEKFFRFP